MEQQGNKINIPFLERLAREDIRFNGWKGVALEWMRAFEAYFDDDEDNEHDDLPESDGEDDEGIVEDVVYTTATSVSHTRMWMNMFCVVRCATVVDTRHRYCLCMKCYACYIELYPMSGIYHSTSMRHKTYQTFDEAFAEMEWKCSSCLSSLCQIIPQEICQCCNNL